jgi:Ca2+-binding RTX toxin-like protein
MAIINGNESANTLTGGSAADTLNGLGGNDTLLGNGDNDTLDGGTGNDLLIGGRGSDTYRFGLGYGFDVIDNSGGANSDVDTIWLTNLNANQVRLTRIGNDLVLSILTTGETLTVSQHFLDADHAIDRIQFADGSRWSASDILANLFYPPVVPTNGADVINGNPGDDILLGLGGNDTLLGNGGNDTLDGGSGNDRMEGGVGNDTYVVDAAADVVVEANNAGDDLVQASINYNLGNNVERLTLTGSANINGTGNALDNTLNGNAGNNILDGGSGNDLIQGGEGDDTLQGGAGNDNLKGDAGNDLLDGGAGNDSMAGGSGNDIYIVAQAADVASEQPGDGIDTVRSSVNYSLGANLENLELSGSSNLNGTGNALANSLTGNTGSNRLDGGAGDDVLAGRRGSDTYLYGSNYGNDVIDNSGGAAADVDTVQLVGLNSGNVRFVHIGNDLQMVVLATSQTLTVKNFYLGADYEIDRVRFDNNVVWNTATLKAAATSPVNVAPTSTNDSRATLEDTPVILGSTDFGTYSDPENSPLASVKITGLPLLGSLQYNNGSAWGAVVQDQVISKADLDAGKLQFVPAINGNGSGYASIGFKVSDGTAFSINANTLSVDVTPVNDAPVVSVPGALPSGLEDTTYNITAAQLLANVSDPDGDALSVANLSTNHGTLVDNGDGNWTFTPDANYNGAVTLNYEVNDGNGGSVATNQGFSLTAINDAPTGTVAISGSATAGQILSASHSLVDVDGLGIIGYQWQRSSDGNSWSAITSATGNTYTLSAADVGQQVRVEARYFDDGGTAEVMASAATTAVVTQFNLIEGGPGNDPLTGTAAADRLLGHGGNDTLLGLAGDDELDGGAGNDLLDGGAGNDSAVYSAGMNQYSFTFDPHGYLAVEAGVGSGEAGQDQISAVEQLRFANGTITVNGASGGEVLVNTTTASDQFGPSMAALAGGGYVVIWHATNLIGSGLDIFAQRYDASGNKLGDEVLVNAFLANDQTNPSVAGLVGGGYLVTWESFGQDGSGSGIYAQRFDAEGRSQGSEVQVNTFTSGDQMRPVVAALTSGDYVVSWMSNGQDGNSSGIYAQQYSASGVALGSEVRVNSNTFGPQEHPAVAALSDGGYIVSWMSATNADRDIFLQRYSASGTSLGGEVRVNTTTGGEQFDPKVAAFADGGYIVTWMSMEQDGDSWGIYAQRYAASGTAVGDEVRVNSTTINDQQQPVVAILNDGGYVVSWISWNQDGNGYGVYAQRYDASGAAAGGELHVSSTTAGSQQQPTITGLSDGGYVVSWMSYGQDGSGWGIYAQRYDASGQAAVNTLTLAGDAGDNLVQLGSGDECIAGGGGNDTLIGGEGHDTALYQGRQHDFAFGVQGVGLISVNDLNPADGNEGLDTLHNFETLQFGDGVRLQGLSGEVQVSSTTFNAHTDPVVGALGDGGYVVCWTSMDQDGGWDIYAQRYSASGATVGGETRVNSTLSNNQLSPAIDGLSDGGYVVSWMSDGQDGSDWGIYAQRFSASGTAVNGEIQINTFTDNGQYTPKVAALADGGYVVSWMSYGQQGNNWGIYTQRFDASDAAVGGEVRVNANTVESQQPVIAGLDDGGYVVSWMSWGQDGSGYGVYAQRYDASGAAVGGEVQVNSTNIGHQLEPTICALSDGGYVVSWRSNNQDGGADIYAQRYDASGVAVAGEVQVSSTSLDGAYNPVVCTLNDGGYVMSWTSIGDGGNWDIFSQRYSAVGTAVGGEVLVNTTTFANQLHPAIDALTDGGYVVSWTSNHQNEGGFGNIYSQRYDVNGNPVLDHLEWTGDASANLIRSTVETDWFNGGAGADTFQFAQLPGAHADLITDFTPGSDVLALKTGVFNLQGQTVAEALANVSGGQNEAAGANLVFNQDDHTLYYDADGAANGNAIALVTLVGVTTLTGSDMAVYG